MYRTVTDGPDGYVYGEWTSLGEALLQKRVHDQAELTWVEDEEHNRVS